MKINRKNKIKEPVTRNVIFGIYFVLFILFSLFYLYPIFWCFINSLKTTEEFMFNPHGLPEVWNIGFYGEIIKTFKVGSVNFPTMIWNSIWQAFGGQALNILASLCVAYPLARYNFHGKKLFYGIIVFRITIPIIGSGAAGYKLLRALNMINNPPAFMLSYFSGFDMAALIMYGYFKNISKEYSEAAFIDGATVMQTFLFVVMPQAVPCVIALYVSNVMGNWNNYSTPMINLPKYPNLALGIYEIDRSSSFLGANGLAKKYGAIVLSAIVPVLLFTLSQKTMLENMSVGGLKG